MKMIGRDDQVNRIYEHADSITRESLQREIELAEERGAEEVLAAQYLTIKQAAKHLKCSREAIYHLIRDGRVTFISSVSGRRLIARHTLTDQRDTRLEPTKVRLSPTMRHILARSLRIQGAQRMLLCNGELNNRRTIRALLRRRLIEHVDHCGWCLTDFGEHVRATLPEVAS